MQGLKACAYHAGQSDGERASVQTSWINGEYKVRSVVETNVMRLSKMSLNSKKIKTQFSFAMYASISGLC